MRIEQRKQQEEIIVIDTLERENQQMKESKDEHGGG